MRASTTSNPLLLQTIWPARVTPIAIRAVVLAFAGAGLMTLAAKISVPFWPVPMTMQTLAVALIGLTYGPRLAFASLALYLTQGLVGLPVFVGTPAQGIGPAYMMGPTGGYLVGFLLAAWAVGALAARGWSRTVPKAFLAVFVGELVIFGCGLAWLSTLLGPEKAIAAGLLPFLPGEALKVSLAALAVPAVWRLIRRDQSAG